MLDLVSIKGTCLTVLLGYISWATASGVVMVLTGIAAVTTIVYNVIKIKKEIKK